MRCFRKLASVFLAAIITMGGLAYLRPCYSEAINADIPEITAETKSAVLDSESVYNAIMAMESKYPEGTVWNNNNSYSWKGGTYTTGYGCAGFAFMLSDAAFGDLPARITQTFKAEEVRVGDILHYNGHFVIVLELRQSSFIVAEGNVNGMVYWETEKTYQQIREGFEHHFTRYPVIMTGDVNEDGKVDSADASLVLSEYGLIQTGGTLTFTETQKKSADVNKDGKTDSSDASKILEYYGAVSTGKNPSWE